MQDSEKEMRRCGESERSRGEGETERNGRRVYIRDREGGRKIAGYVNADRMCAVGLCGGG